MAPTFSACCLHARTDASCSPASPSVDTQPALPRLQPCVGRLMLCCPPACPCCPALLPAHVPMPQPPPPPCRYACLNMELRECKPPIFTSRQVAFAASCAPPPGLHAQPASTRHSLASQTLQLQPLACDSALCRFRCGQAGICRRCKPPVATHTVAPPPPVAPPRRDCIQRTLKAKGLPHLGELFLANARDLALLIQARAAAPPSPCPRTRCWRTGRAAPGSRGMWPLGARSAEVDRQPVAQAAVLPRWPPTTRLPPPRSGTTSTASGCSGEWAAGAPCNKGRTFCPVHTRGAHKNPSCLGVLRAVNVAAACCPDPFAACRMSSVLCPWMGTIDMEEMPQ